LLYVLTLLVDFTFEKPQRDALANAVPESACARIYCRRNIFCFWLVAPALLVYRPRFLPRFLGVWLALAGSIWVILSLTSVVLLQY
jgi:hypothetical protein